MAANYTHSRVFADMKRTRERIKGNPATSDYLQVLDAYLTRALLPIVRDTTYFNNALATYVGWQDTHRKRKVSSMAPNTFKCVALAWLLTPKVQDRIDTLDKLRLDRGLIISLCTQFLKETDRYAEACSATLKMGNGKLFPFAQMLAYKQEVERAFGSTVCLMSARTDVHRWLDTAIDYKSQILEKFTRAAISAAQSDYVRYFDKEVPLDELCNAYILSVTRAIDRTDPKLGVLATQVKFVFYAARTHMERTRPDRTAVDIDDHLDAASTPSAEEDMDQQQRVQLIQNIAAALDPRGAARVYLGITET